MAPISLKRLWEERSAQGHFKIRDEVYDQLEAAWQGREPPKHSSTPFGAYNWRPIAWDPWPPGGERKRGTINVARLIVTHHQAGFARPPRTWAQPVDADHFELAQEASATVRRVLADSNIKLLQPRQAHYLTKRGDAVYGVEWDTAERRIRVKTYDPRWCYPTMNPDDPGALRDLLVTYEVRREWAETTFNVQLPRQDTYRMFVYWDDQVRRAALEDIALSALALDHGLGCVPYRWCFAQPNDHLGQSDLLDVPQLQNLLSECLLMVMDATAKQVDPAYWGRGIVGDNVVPRPGEVVALRGPDAMIDKFPTAEPPAELTNVMSLIQNLIQSGAGISPISAEGMASGSIVTGSAIRHQVEAIEARMETRRTSLEQTYAWLGTTILAVMEHVFPQAPLVQRARHYAAEPTAVNAADWKTCLALYGGLEGLGVNERLQAAMSMLGRMVGARRALELVFPEEDPEPWLRDLEHYQEAQAVLTGRSQALAQRAMAEGAPQSPQGAPQAPQQGQQPSPSSGGPQRAPQAAQQPAAGPPPGLAAGMPGLTTVSELETLIKLVAARLKGQVWATGELALTGRSARPEVTVEVEADRQPVTAALSSKQVDVRVGLDGDEPKIALA